MERWYGRSTRPKFQVNSQESNFLILKNIESLSCYIGYIQQSTPEKVISIEAYYGDGDDNGDGELCLLGDFAAPSPQGGPHFFLHSILCPVKVDRHNCVCVILLSNLTLLKRVKLPGGGPGPLAHPPVPSRASWLVPHQFTPNHCKSHLPTICVLLYIIS